MCQDVTVLSVIASVNETESAWSLAEAAYLQAREYGQNLKRLMYFLWSMKIFGTNLDTLGGSQTWMRQQAYQK